MRLRAYVGVGGTMFACDRPTDPMYETAYMGRSIVVTTMTTFTGNTSDPELFIPFSNAEYTSLQTKSLGTTGNPNDDISGIGDIVATKYNGTNENGTSIDNCGTGTSVVVPQSSSSTDLATFAGVAGNYVSFVVSSFSEFNLHGQNDGSPLPITLTSFSGNCNNNGIQLSWTTTTETNVNHFEIYRTRDGQAWEKVAEVHAVGNSSITNTYRATDANGIETMYYKLRSVDNDG
ncbi:MAG TPA: hypothetical protein PLP27_01325 [Crocinitomicaceae bacterium]|nr:hypothetical protein [Crocinitomicaceae bacterium]